jgi:hypothetical protein
MMVTPCSKGERIPSEVKCRQILFPSGDSKVGELGVRRTKAMGIARAPGMNAQGRDSPDEDDWRVCPSIYIDGKKVQKGPRLFPFFEKLFYRSESR